MNIVDVTLRDGGFTCDFDWPIEFAQEYYNLVTQLGVSCIELGILETIIEKSKQIF